jgi:hypothetical protein
MEYVTEFLSNNEILTRLSEALKMSGQRGSRHRVLGRERFQDAGSRHDRRSGPNPLRCLQWSMQSG